MNTIDLNGKIAVVTGGGQGIGRACALQLATDGAAIAIWDWDEGKGKETGPKENSLDNSIHNPHPDNDTNKKLDQILDMLSGMKKAMSDLEARILKLEKSQLSNIPHLPPPVIHQSSETQKPNQNSSNSHINKRSRIANTSSDDSDAHVPHPVNVQLQATINEQNGIIASQQEQLNIMMTQLQSLTDKLAKQ